MKIGFIGLGNMATAMIGGIIKEGIVKPEDILGSSKTEETLQKAVDAFGICGMVVARMVLGLKMSTV